MAQLHSRKWCKASLTVGFSNSILKCLSRYSIHIVHPAPSVVAASPVSIFNRTHTRFSAQVTYFKDTIRPQPYTADSSPILLKATHLKIRDLPFLRHDAHGKLPLRSTERAPGREEQVPRGHAQLTLPLQLAFRERF